MKKQGQENKPEPTSVKDQAIAENLKNPSFDYAAEQKKIAEAINLPVSAIDSAETDNIVELEDKIAREDAPPAFDMQDGNQSYPREFYEEQAKKGFQPAVEVSGRKSGFSPKDTHDQFNNLLGNRTFQDLTEAEKQAYFSKELAKPATEMDLSRLDESMVMTLPQIKATSFKIIDMLNPKPKDPNMRFKWANCKNNIAGNLGRYIALGFVVASVDDVDQNATPIDRSMIDGTQIKYYDVVLLKINVLELMGLYKSNVLRSIMRLGKVKEKGISEANRQFRADISEIPGASNAYNKVKAGLGGREPVEFFTPGLEESEVVNK